jgi:hypothetical protein
MNILPSPSSLLSFSCNDIVSCFQTIYNILFIILLGLAFLWFLFGAFEYLLSSSGYYNVQKGKSRMISAILSIVVVLIIPPILYLIDPNIFKGKLQIPKIKVATNKIIFQTKPGYFPANGNESFKNLIKDFKPNCNINIPTGPCREDNLQKYLPKSLTAEEKKKLVRKLALICYYSSGGNPIYLSPVNICLDNSSFSFGLFNINMMAAEVTSILNDDCAATKIFDFGDSNNSNLPPFENGRFLCYVKKINLYTKCNGLLRRIDVQLALVEKLSSSFTNFSKFPVWEKGLKKCFP